MAFPALNSRPDVKQDEGSYSFVEEGSLRFLQALPSTRSDPLPPSSPSPPLPALREGTSTFARSSLSLSLRRGTTTMTAGGASPPSSSPPLPTAHARPPSPARSPPPPGLSQPPQPRGSDTRSTSRSGRLTAGLAKLTGGKKERRRGSEDANNPPASVSTGGGSVGAESIPVSGRRRGSSAARRLSNGGIAALSSSQSSAPPHTSSSRSSKPPVSLPNLFRRRLSSGAQNPSAAAHEPAPSVERPLINGGGRRSLEGTRATSSGSEDSYVVVDGSPSLASTAPTSPDRNLSSFGSSSGILPAEPEAVTVQEHRRRGSILLAQSLGSGESTGGDEDLADFVAASGSSSVSPTSPTTPFSHFSPKPPQSSAFTASPPQSPTLSSESDNTTAAVVPRRLTRNIEGLHLSDIRPSPPLPSASQSSCQSANAAPPPSPPSVVTITSSQQPLSALPPFLANRSDTPNSTSSSQRLRLGALPRLLSSQNFAEYASPSYSAVSGEEEQEPDESDTEGEGESSSDDEGERYATGDEGPVTVRSRDVTPAQTPGLTATTPRGPPATPGGFPSLASRLPSMTGLSMTASRGGVPGPASWVSFAPGTPTPSIRTARPPVNDQPSYFDLPRPGPSASARTPGLVPQTPLVPMSISDVARGKRPELQVDVEATTPGLAPSTEQPQAAQLVETPGASMRAGLYRMRSQSVVDLASPSMVDSDDQPVGTAAVNGLDPIWQSGGVRTPGPSFLSLSNLATQVQTSPISQPISPTTPRTTAPFDIPPAGSPPQPSQPSSPVTARQQRLPGAKLHRPRSMYELRVAPPAYTAPLYNRPGLDQPQIIQPRDEEGEEELPGYSNAIHISGYMPRKMEFTSPGVQAKDRAWKRQYVVLHGTSIKVYKFDLRTHPIAGEDDWSTIPAAIAGDGGPPPLHFHEGEYGAASSSNGHSNGARTKFPLSVGDARAKAKSRILEGATAASSNQVLRHYSLQNAESGLAADYVKRKHVVRLRAEGEQFLLQAKDDRGVIDLIEALQAATNVALDLDARPLPKFITLPRRRRRRRPRPDAAGTDATAATAGGTAAAAAPPAPDRMGDMLAEEQNAYSRRSGATVM